jgi:hypothetical protein
LFIFSCTSFTDAFLFCKLEHIHHMYGTNVKKHFRGNYLSEFKITNFNFICTFFCRSRNYSNATGRQQKKETQVLKDDRTNKSNFFNAFKPVYSFILKTLFIFLSTPQSHCNIVCLYLKWSYHFDYLTNKIDRLKSIEKIRFVRSVIFQDLCFLFLLSSCGVWVISASTKAF